ncbi:MAG: NAD(P)/FAD-dependent oxidoreductase [Pseudomonadales bacterium]
MRVAIVGGGVSGLAAADRLQRHSEVTLFEAQRRLGGHSDSHAIFVDGQTHTVDSGFIMWEPQRAQGFHAWLNELGVRTVPAEVGLGVRDEVSGIEFGTQSLASLFCQRRNVVSPRFLALLGEVRRLHQAARTMAASAQSTLQEFLEQQGFSDQLFKLVLLPLCRALWSLDAPAARALPARYALGQLAGYRVLPFDRPPVWQVFRRGAGSYVDAVVARFGGGIRRGEAVLGLSRAGGQVVITTASGRQMFDAVVLACNSHDALSLLEDPSAAERDILGSMRFARSERVVHSDVRVMPRDPRAWSAWNARIDAGDGCEFTFWMNRILGLRAKTPLFVTVDPEQSIDRVWARLSYATPVLDARARLAQERKHEISGIRNTWYCGAWWGDGLQEDGFLSGIETAAAIADYAEMRRSGGARQERSATG